MKSSLRRPDTDSPAAAGPTARRSDTARRTGGLDGAWADSPRLTAQRARIDGSFGTALQREQEEEEPLQGRGIVQRMDGLEEEEPLQSKAGSPPNRTGMPDELKSGIESLSGMDLSDVRVHRNSPEPARVDALATAQGRDIHLASGQEQHLAHEAWHVVQQAQGRVQPTVQLEGVPVNDDASLEQEADQMGARALQGPPR